MFRAIAALALLSASAHAIAADTKAGSTLSSTAPWWEKVTVTILGDGKAQSCRYQTSIRPDASESCEVAGSSKNAAAGVGGKGEYTRITFERRFSPGAPDSGKVQPGDTLLGRQVLALAIDAAGAVQACQIVATAGDMTTDYDCEEAKAERFEASAGRVATHRQGFMTILVYGHAEHMV